MTPWREVPQWCMGANDKFGTCFFAMIGNSIVLTKGEVMGDGEIENAARVMEGFNPYNPSTDHGEAMETGLTFITNKGWPGDDTLRLDSFASVQADNLSGILSRNGFVFAWLQLPMGADDDGYDFTDAALARNAPGVYSHAVLLVDVSEEVTFITWAAPQTVSKAWADRYFRGFYSATWVDESVVVPKTDISYYH